MKLNLIYIISSLFFCLIAFGYTDRNISNESSSKGLTLKQADALIKVIDNKQKALDKDSLKSGWDKQKFIYNNKILKFKVNKYGEKPADGRSLYISMHGGGNTAAAVNDQQWHNQVIMTSDLPTQYHINEGVVIVPRAPVDDWNMWFQYEIDNLLADAIRAAVLFADVNPNKVYIMGYSAGGDGVYRLATRMADYWAGASMSAGHPGETTPVNLRNIAFALNMGGKDNPYDRNKHAATWKIKLDSLQKMDPAGYPHLVNIFEDKAHWMEMEDAIAIPFIASFSRNPYPNKVIWQQNSFHIRSHFYWLGISKADTEIEGIADNPQKVIQVSYHGNTINIDHNYASDLIIYLNDNMVDLDKKVTINYQGKCIFNGKVKRSANVIQQTASERKDSAYIFSSKLVVKNNAKVIIDN